MCPVKANQPTTIHQQGRGEQIIVLYTTHLFWIGSEYTAKKKNSDVLNELRLCRLLPYLKRNTIQNNLLLQDEKWRLFTNEFWKFVVRQQQLSSTKVLTAHCHIVVTCDIWNFICVCVGRAGRTHGASFQTVCAVGIREKRPSSSCLEPLQTWLLLLLSGCLSKSLANLFI